MYTGKLTSARTAVCECSDQGCPAHVGVADCTKLAISLLRRIDMDDRTGTWFCRDCSSDASHSGLYDY